MRFLIFRFTDPPTPNSLVLEKKIKLKFRPNFFCWVELFTTHKAHGKLNHDYIRDSCTHGHKYLGSIKENSHSL